MKQNQKKIINTLIIVVLTILALYINLKDVYKEVLGELSNINIFYLLVAIFLILFYCFLDGVAITIFSKIYNKSYTVIRGFKNTVIGMFFSAISPFASAGEISKIYILSKQGLKTSEATSVLIMNFIIFQMSLLFWGILGVSLKFNYFYTNHTGMFYLVLLGFLINMSLSLAIFLAAKSKMVHKFISDKVLKFLNKIKVIKNYESAKEKFDEQIETFKVEFSNLLNNKKILISVLLVQIIRLSCYYSIAFFCLKALDVTIPFNLLFDSMLLTILIVNILSVTPIPGDSGVSETIYILIFTTLFNKVLVSSSMITWRFISFYVPMIIGALFLLFNKNLKKDVEQEIAVEKLKKKTAKNQT